MVVHLSESVAQMLSESFGFPIVDKILALFILIGYSQRIFLVGAHRHRVLNIVCYNDTFDSQLDFFRVKMGEDGKYLVGPIQAMNGFTFWFLADNGSKLGWENSKEMEEYRQKLITLLKANMGYDGGVQRWCEVFLYDETINDDKDMRIGDNSHGTI